MFSDTTKSTDLTNSAQFNVSRHAPTQSIKVIGVGGGGNNAVDHMFEQGIKDVSFVLINTDKQVLDESPIPTKLVIGPGRGAGGKPERARDYAEKSAAEIAELFDGHTDMVFITAGMGGGTGTGAGPVVARIAKEMDILTVGIVTIPFLFEGRRKVLKALEGAREMAKNVDALLIINNERLNEIYPDLSIFNAFAKADDTLLHAASGITEIITNRGIINRDFNDVDSTLREGGTAIISSGYGEGENRVSKAIEDALNSPLLRNTDIYGSKKILLVLYVNEDEDDTLAMSETTQITEFVNSIDQDVDVMWGLYKAKGLGNKVKVTILASGFDVTVDDVPADLSYPKPHGPAEPGKKQSSQPDADDKEAAQRIIAQQYGSQGAATLTRGAKPPVMDPAQLNDESAIAAIDTPAYQRMRRPGQSAVRPVVKPAAPAAAAAAQPSAAEKPADGTDAPNDNGIVGSISFSDIK